MNQIIKLLSQRKQFDNLMNSQKVIHCGNDESFAFYVYYQYSLNKRQMVIVTENLYACQNMYNKLSMMLKDNVYMYCVDEITKYTSLATSPEMVSQRLYVLNKLLENEPIIVVTHTMAVKRLTPSKAIYQTKTINLKVNQETSLNHIIYQLVKNGYKNVYKVTQPFEFSTRGGVIDIFSINYENPIRIEFFDTEIESIRFFDIETQRTINSINNVKILPACEFLFNDLDSSIDKIKAFAKAQIDKSDNNLQLESVVNEDIEHIRFYDFNESLYKYYSFFDSYGTLSDYLDNAEVILLNEDKIKDNELFIESETFEESIKNYEEGIALKDFYLFDSYLNFKNSLRKYNVLSTDINICPRFIVLSMIIFSSLSAYNEKVITSVGLLIFLYSLFIL